MPKRTPFTKHAKMNTNKGRRASQDLAALDRAVFRGRHGAAAREGHGMAFFRSGNLAVGSLGAHAPEYPFLNEGSIWGNQKNEYLHTVKTNGQAPEKRIEGS